MASKTLGCKLTLIVGTSVTVIASFTDTFGDPPIIESAIFSVTVIASKTEGAGLAEGAHDANTPADSVDDPKSIVKVRPDAAPPPALSNKALVYVTKLSS